MEKIATSFKKNVWNEINDYLMLCVASIAYSIGWALFLLPNKIAPGGIPGISSIVQWGFEVPTYVTFFIMNAILLSFAMKILGFKFCVKTIVGVVVLTLSQMVVLDFAQKYGLQLLTDQKFLAAIIGSAFCGTGVGIALVAGGSTGGSDVVAAMVNKYKDISLGRIILMVDMIIISSSYFVMDGETVAANCNQVIMGYVGLIVASFSVDLVVNSRRKSVQFFVISPKHEEIARRINLEPRRGCTIIKAQGSYTKKDANMLFVLTKARESAQIFRIIQEVDPSAFVSQSAVIGVYGAGFDKFKVR